MLTENTIIMKSLLIISILLLFANPLFSQDNDDLYPKGINNNKDQDQAQQMSPLEDIDLVSERVIQFNRIRLAGLGIQLLGIGVLIANSTNNTKQDITALGATITGIGFAVEIGASIPLIQLNNDRKKRKTIR